METLNVLSKFNGKRLENIPAIQHNNLFKRIRDNFHFELFLKGSGAEPSSGPTKRDSAPASPTPIVLGLTRGSSSALGSTGSSCSCAG